MVSDKIESLLFVKKINVEVFWLFFSGNNNIQEKLFSNEINPSLSEDILRSSLVVSANSTICIHAINLGRPSVWISPLLDKSLVSNYPNIFWMDPTEPDILSQFNDC